MKFDISRFCLWVSTCGLLIAGACGPQGLSDQPANGINGGSIAPPQSSATPLPRIDPTKLPSAFSLKQGVDRDIAEYWDRCKDEKVSTINDLQDYIALSTKTGMSDEVADDQKQLAEDCDPNTIIEPSLLVVTEGEIGRIYDAKIVQIIDQSNALLDVQINQALDNREVIWITGWSTEGYVDDSKAYLPTVRVVGIRQYDSALGQRTVHMVTPFEIHYYLEKQTPTESGVSTGGATTQP
jgi:hypothetical protein